MPALIAQQVLNARWNGVLPVDVVGMALDLGARVFETKQLARASGEARLIGGVPYLYCCAHDPISVQRFTIAHEFGHWMLGHLKGARVRNRRASVEPADHAYEQAADQFAEALLMPASTVLYVVGHEQIADIRRLSRIFDVPLDVIGRRIDSLLKQSAGELQS